MVKEAENFPVTPTVQLGVDLNLFLPRPFPLSGRIKSILGSHPHPLKPGGQPWYVHPDCITVHHVDEQQGVMESEKPQQPLQCCGSIYPGGSLQICQRDQKSQKALSLASGLEFLVG